MEPGVTLSRRDPDFFVALGAKIAALRKEAGMTQVQLAERLQCSQQHLVAYEKGRYRIPANLLLVIAKELDVSLDDLFGVESKPSKSGPTSKIERQLEQLSKLPRGKQRFVTEMIEIALQRAQG